MDILVLHVAVVAAIAGFVQGLSGFAFALIATSLWSWSLAPQIAGPLVVFCSFIGQVMAIGVLRNGFSWPRLWPYLLGGAAGVPVGVALLRGIDPLTFRAAFGLLLVVWCPVMLFARKLPQITFGGRWADGVVGVIGGVLGGIGGLAGPAPTLWCTLRAYDRDAARAVMQSFNLAMHTITLVTYIATGTIPDAALPLFLVAVPAMLVPTLLGMRMYRSISDILFRRIVLALLAASGAALLANTLPKLL